METVALENGAISYIIHCKIKDKNIVISVEDIGRALGLYQQEYDAIVSDEQLTEFFEFIRHKYIIKVGNLNRKYLRKEWSCVFGTLLQVLMCRKSSFDQLSAHVQQIGYSLAYETKIDVGKLIM